MNRNMLRSFLLKLHRNGEWALLHGSIPRHSEALTGPRQSQDLVPPSPETATSACSLLAVTVLQHKIALFIRFLLIQMLIICAITPSCFANFGESCSIAPRASSDDNLILNTAFGYILNNIDMQTYITNGCDNTGDEFNFCIRNATGGSSPCTPVKKNVGDTFPLNSITTNPDLIKPSIKDIMLTVSAIESQVCLTMPTSRGEMPIVCRNGAPPVIGADLGGTETCRNIADSCYSGSSKSQSLVNFSGLTVQCLQETLNKVFYETNNCTPAEENVAFSSLNSFSAFQEALKVSIRAALIIYVIVYGFQLVMNGEMAHLDKIAMFLAKVILVSYFSVGLGPLYFEAGKETHHNGMTEIVLPMLVQLTSDFTEIVFLSGGSQGLCVYDASKYQQGYEYYKVWDAIDCRIGYYLGMQLLYNVSGFIRDASSTTTAEVGTSANFNQESNSDAIGAIRSASNPTFFSVMFGLFMAGNIIIVLCGLVFVVVFLSIILYFLTSYLVCTVTLYVMAYISPIFIPMVLFEQTKSYFDSWMKVTLSCALQPAVIGGFLAIILTMYDGAIYGNCEFQRYDYTFSEINFSTFELRLPNSEPEKCSNSAGYKLMKYYMGEGWDKVFVIIFVIRTVKDVLDLGSNMIYVMIFTFIFYFFVKSVNEFASDLTSGASMAAVTASPTKIIDMALKAASYSKKAMGNMGGNKASAGKASKGGGGEGKDKGPGEEGGAKDKARGGGAEGATDKLSGGMKGGGK